MKKLFLLLLTVAALTMAASAQTRVVKGVVMDAADNEPLPGATIQPVGGGSGAATDVDGRFSLTLPQSVTKITVSYVGMQSQTVTIQPGEMIIRLLNSGTKLDEVMVVAYGTAKKSSFTGSAAVVGSAEIEQLQVTNALDALNGSVPGVQVTNQSGAPGQENPQIRIRGISSINAGNQPLVVVDGVPYSGDINMIAASDIESMTVLKDAASNALYGARGANGVILITTKKGKGDANAKVTFDAKWGSNSRATKKYKTIDNPAEYYETYYKYLYNFAVNSKQMSPEAANAWVNDNIVNTSSENTYTLGYNAFRVPEGETFIGMDGKVNPNAVLGNFIQKNGEWYKIAPDNWLDEAYRNALRQEYSLSVANQSDNGSFYASFSWLSNEGIVKNTDYTRLTGRLSADIQAKPWLKVGGNLSYVRYKSNSLDDDGESASSGNVFAAATHVAPIYPLYLRDAFGNVMIDSFGNTMYDYGDGMNAGLVRPVFGGSNAIGSSRLDTNKAEGNAFNGIAFVEIRFLKDFKFTSNNNFAVDDTRYTSVTNPYYGMYSSSNGIVSKQQVNGRDYAFQQLLNWNRMFGKHNVGLLLGHENYWRKYNVLYASRSGMFDPSNSELSGAIINGNSNSYDYAYNNEGYLFRAQYDYDSKYFGSMSFRRDASSRFHPDHRWGNFWSFGAAWIISKESFFTAPWVDQLKIKASYGEQGNDNIGQYRYTNTYQIVNSNGNPAAQPYQMGNKNITWEKGQNFNAGVDFAFFNERLNGTVEAFYRKTSDMLFSFPLAPSFGFSSYYANVGDMRNVGFEIELSGTVFQTKDFTWDLNANLTYYKNKIIMLPGERKSMSVDGHEGFSNGNFFIGEGVPMYTYHLKKYAGTDKVTGEPLYYMNVKDENGNITGRSVTNDYSKADYYLCGTALASTYGGFGTSLKYKGFDFTIDFNFQIGGKCYDSDYQLLMSNPTSQQRGVAMHRDVLASWSASNPTSNIPRMQYDDLYTTSSSDRWLVDASYLALRNINFGYTLPANLTRKAHIDKIRVYLTCDNVALWSARQGLDPRQGLNGETTGAFYAPMRTISGGINVVF